MTTPSALEYGQYYHIYNRGNNRETLFRNERNYHYFIKLYSKHIYPVADTFAYCLLSNHFHFAVRIKTEEEIYETLRVFPKVSSSLEQTPKTRKVSTPSQRFGNLFNAYAKSINKAYERTGSLFEKPFHRKIITDDAYFWRLILYIHHNPQKHGMIDDFRLWPFSSYNSLISDQPTRLKQDEVIAAFGDMATFKKDHNEYKSGGMDEEFS